MQIQEKRVRTGPFTTFYREAGAGPPLVLIHGGGPGADSYGNWNDTLPVFARHFQVYAYDMVGFGNSEAPDPERFSYSMDARAQQLYDFIVGIGHAGGKVRLIGNSMGGAAGLGLAMAHPEVVHSMVLMGSAGVPMQLSPEVGKLMHYDFTMQGMRAIATALAYPGFVVPDDIIKYRYDLTMREDIKRGTAATQAWVKANGGPNYPEAEIAKVGTHTLVFHGKNDKVVPLPIAYRMLELLENSHGYILPKCGHWAMLEQPDVFSRVCIEFLR
jgi:pimeloyl-ACP methyl ester carboxylesterase